MVFGFFIIMYRGCILRWMSSHYGFPAVLVRMLFCFTETWVKPDNLPITILVFELYCLHLAIRRPGECHPAGYLAGSCICVPDGLSIEQTPLCKDIKNSCKFLNVACCLIACKSTKIALHRCTDPLLFVK